MIQHPNLEAQDDGYHDHRSTPNCRCIDNDNDEATTTIAPATVHGEKTGSGNAKHNGEVAGMMRRTAGNAPPAFCGRIFFFSLINIVAQLALSLVFA